MSLELLIRLRGMRKEFGRVVVRRGNRHLTVTLKLLQREDRLKDIEEEGGFMSANFSYCWNVNYRLWEERVVKGESRPFPIELKGEIVRRLEAYNKVQGMLCRWGEEGGGSYISLYGLPDNELAGEVLAELDALVMKTLEGETFKSGVNGPAEG